MIATLSPRGGFRFLGALFVGVCLGWINQPIRADFEVYPPSIKLDGPGHTHGLLVLGSADTPAGNPPITGASYKVDPPELGRVSGQGTFQAAASGKGKLAVTWKGQTKTIPLEVGARPWGTQVSFSNDIIPMLTRSGCNSGACHGALAGKGTLKLSLRGYDPMADWNALVVQQGARRTDFDHPPSSLFLRKALRDIPHAGGKKWEKGSREESLILKWIERGALPPNDTERKVAKLNAFPPRVVSTPQAAGSIPMLVQAEYSDGTQADVSGLAKYHSSTEEVAGVDTEGWIRVVGQGEAGLSAWFNNQVAMITLSSPRQKNAASNATPTSNPIDTRINAKLETLGIPPSPLCDDATFLRRVSLDLCGVLPTLEDQQAFFALPQATRRQEWVDRLLNRPEFVDFQAYRLFDQFLISTKKIPQSGVWAFSRFLRQAVEENRPYDRMCREILTARGSNLDRGEVNFFLMHRDTAELTETVSVTFMGMSLACAKCHNHPMEKWTQDQYWSMANSFGRVNLKNGERADEVILVEAKTGDVNHLRKGVPFPPRPLDGPLLEGDRREAFARWLTSPENAWFARAQVNRLWKSVFGRGLVENDDDLRLTNPATHPELLDWLAQEFVKQGYDNKKMLKLMVTSAAYQRSSKSVPGNETDDRFLSHARLKRLSAEVLLDALSQVSGVPTHFDAITPGGGNGSQPYAGYPLGTRAIQLPDSAVVSPFLDAFGRPERNQACSCERQQDTTVGQALHVANGSTLNEKLKSPQGFPTKWATDGSTPESVIERLWKLGFTRTPTPEEKNQALGVLKPAWDQDLATRKEAIEDLFWAVLTSREFLFNH